jgi:uncharacterized RDD family membrane protein YckC
MLCPNCRRETEAGFFCHVCDAYVTNPSVGSNAGIPRRLGAQILDIATRWVVLAVIGVGSCAMGSVGIGVGVRAPRQPDLILGAGTFLTSFLLAFMAYVTFLLWFLAQGQTPGKWLVGIRVTDKSEGNRPGLARMLIRETIGKFVSGFVFRLGYLRAIWDRETRAWHDKIAGIFVTRQPAVVLTTQTATVAPSGAEAATVSPDRPMLPAGGVPTKLTSALGVQRSSYDARPGSSFCTNCGERFAST